MSEQMKRNLLQRSGPNQTKKLLDGDLGALVSESQQPLGPRGDVVHERHVLAPLAVGDLVKAARVVAFQVAVLKAPMNHPLRGRRTLSQDLPKRLAASDLDSRVAQSARKRINAVVIGEFPLTHGINSTTTPGSGHCMRRGAYTTNRATAHNGTNSNRRMGRWS